MTAKKLFLAAVLTIVLGVGFGFARAAYNAHTFNEEMNLCLAIDRVDPSIVQPRDAVWFAEHCKWLKP